MFLGGSLTTSGLGGEEGHQSTPGEFFQVLDEMFSCDTVLACVCHNLVRCQVLKTLALLWQNTYASLTVSRVLSPGCHSELISQTRCWRSAVHKFLEWSHLAALEQERKHGVMLWLRPETVQLGTVQRNRMRECSSRSSWAEWPLLLCDLTNNLLQIQAGDAWRVCISWCLTWRAYIATNVATNSLK